MKWFLKATILLLKKGPTCAWGCRTARKNGKKSTSATAPVDLAGFPTIAQGESVTWENDKFGFRVYFDCRNAKDLFGKLKPVMIADKVHTPEMGSYHELADWGMDVLHCGSSPGAGGLAMLENDSLFRLGSTERFRIPKSD